MKKLLILIVGINIIISISAQNNTADYMMKIPALPRDSCNITKANAEYFTTSVGNLLDQLESDIETRNEMVNNHMENNEAKAKETAMKQMSQMYGVSQEDLNKMQNSKGMSATEKQALANQMLMQQANMSMEEVKNLSKMSEAGKQAYAQAYAAEAMATTQPDPKQQARNANARSLNEMVGNQQVINAKLSALNQQIISLYSPIENDPEGQKMLNNISTWNGKLTSMMGIVSAKEEKTMDSLSLLIRNESVKYCNRFTPKYRAALRQHLAILKKSLPEYRSLGELTAQVTKAQTGIDTPPEGIETFSLQAIENYLGKLKDAYKYKIYYAEDH